VAKKSNNSKLNRNVGASVKLARLAAGLSQDAFADLLAVHRTYVGSIERGEANITLQTLERIADALKVSPETLLADHDGGGDV
jgi:transcriptional regulator with XRE-family HTH domain